MSTTNDRRTGVPVRRWRRIFSKRLLLAWGAVLAAALLVTSGLTMAAFTDKEYAQLTGIGTGEFELVSMEAGDTYANHDAEHVLVIALPSAGRLIPGADPVTTTIDVKNTGDYTSTMSIEVAASGSNALIGELILTVKANAGVAQPLVPGTPTSLPDLAKGDNMLITIGVQLHQRAGNGLQDQQATLTATITGESKVPGG